MKGIGNRIDGARHRSWQGRFNQREGRGRGRIGDGLMTAHGTVSPEIELNGSNGGRRMNTSLARRLGGAALVITIAGASLAGVAGPASAAPAKPAASQAQARSARADVASAGWRLYSIFASPQACWYNGYLGVWSGLWYNFECIGVNITPIGPGLDYLWVN